MDHSHTVALRRCSDDESIARAVTLLAEDTAFLLRDNLRIVIKPNLNDLSGPYSGFTTDVRVVDALVKYINAHSHPDQIYIVESDSWNRLAGEAFEQLGYTEIASAQKNVKLVNLTKTSGINVELPIPSFYDVIRIPRLFLDANLFISVAKLRTHHTVISGILKNQFGCIPRRFKGRYHAYLNDILPSLNLLMRPDWSLVDGIIGRDVRPRELDLLLASHDPVAADSVSARIMGFDPRRIPHISRAAAKSVGTMDPESVLLDGKPVTNLDSIISPKFIGPSPLGLRLTNLGLALTRTTNRSKGIGDFFVKIGALWTGASQYSKKEILEKLRAYGMVKAVYDSLQVGGGRRDEV